MLVCLLVPVSVAHLRHHSRELDCRWLRVERSPEASKGVWFSQRARLRLCDSHNFPTTLGDRRAPVLPGILQAITDKQQRLHASVRKNYEICGSAIDLHRVACATASKKSTFAAPRATVCSPRRLSSMTIWSRAQRGAVPRYPWRTHTFRTLIFGKPMRQRLSFAARGNFTE